MAKLYLPANKIVYAERGGAAPHKQGRPIADLYFTPLPIQKIEGWIEIEPVNHALLSTPKDPLYNHYWVKTADCQEYVDTPPTPTQAVTREQAAEAILLLMDYFKQS